MEKGEVSVMTEQKVSIEEIVRYGGHNQQASGAVNVTFIADYDQLAKTIMVNQMLNNDVMITAKVESGKPFKLGSFRVKTIVIDGDGESKLKFNGLCDFIEMDSLNRLPLKTEENPRVKLFMAADVEMDDVQEDADDWEDDDEDDWGD